MGSIAVASMKRLRPSQWTSTTLLQPSRQAAAAAIISKRQPFSHATIRCQSSSATSESTTIAAEPIIDDNTTTTTLPLEDNTPITITPLPSPSPDKALKSAKLAALHARLSLSNKIPLQTLARALVHPSADPNASFNNRNLSFLGSTIINYHALEYLVCKWPRLPMAILYEALRAFAGPESLAQLSKRWGLEAAAAPGGEVDPGLLQWSHKTNALPNTRWGAYVRPETERKETFYRRGLSSRVVLDDDFGDTTHSAQQASFKDPYEQRHDEAFSSFAQAVVGSIYTHCGREAAKSFIDSHILSRQLDLSALFSFNLPTRELAMLCAREGFQPPLARLESETGRHSRTPVYVVGIYSGKEKIGEGASASLDFARRKACMAALKSWYLYSPGNKVRVPSDMMENGAKPWTAPYIDIGEVI